jgi:putative nucleotidyltransferase with HDIG domain
MSATDEMARLCSLNNINSELTARWVTAAVLHDIGKIRCTEFDHKKNKITSHEHDVVGADMARKFLERFIFGKAFVNEVCHLIKNHMFTAVRHGQKTDKIARWLWFEFENKNIIPLEFLVLADHSARPPLPKKMPDVDAEVFEKYSYLVGIGFHRIVTGKFIQENLPQVPQGPAYQYIMDRAKKAQIKGSLRDEETALEICKNLYLTYEKRKTE